jgi:hypothetical protein
MHNLKRILQDRVLATPRDGVTGLSKACKSFRAAMLAQYRRPRLSSMVLKNFAGRSDLTGR